MVRQYIVDKSTTRTVVKPYKQMISEFKDYMEKSLNVNQQVSEHIISIGKTFTLIRYYMDSQEYSDSYISELVKSDIYSCLYCLKYKLPKRFFYFSFRSTIESFVRLNCKDKETKVVDELFKHFKQENEDIISDNELFTDFYSTLRRFYSEASVEVHSGKISTKDLISSVEAVKTKNDDEHLIKLIKLLRELLDLIKKFYFVKDTNLVILKYQFRFRIAALKYLVTKAEERYIFSSTSPLEDTD